MDDDPGGNRCPHFAECDFLLACHGSILPTISRAVALRLQRPIPVKHDPEHDHRAGRDHRRADHLPVFEHSDNGRPPAKISLPMRKAPACHTHSETSVWRPAALAGYSHRASPWIKVKKAARGLAELILHPAERRVLSILTLIQCRNRPP